MEKHPPTTFLSDYPNVAIIHSTFLQKQLSRVHTRYRKTVGECKHIEDDFFAQGSSNDNLDSEIKKSSWRCSNDTFCIIIKTVITQYFGLSQLYSANIDPICFRILALVFGPSVHPCQQHTTNPKKSKLNMKETGRSLIKNIVEIRERDLSLSST